MTTDSGTGGRQSDGRTNDLAWLPHDHTPEITAIVTKIANLIGLPTENAESLQGIPHTLQQK